MGTFLEIKESQAPYKKVYRASNQTLWKSY